MHAIGDSKELPNEVSFGHREVKKNYQSGTIFRSGKAKSVSKVDQWGSKIKNCSRYLAGKSGF
jgi:hypothetical protein